MTGSGRSGSYLLGFVCVGPQRTATSWLDRALRTHPAIQLPEVVKETYFLDRRYERGWGRYWTEFFPRLSSDVLAGEIAPTVFDHSLALDRLVAHNPQARIIVCLRDPVARSISLFRHYHAISRVGDDFANAVRRHPEIVRASDYREHIARWVAAFGADRVLLVPHSAVEGDALGAVNAIYAFLGVSTVAALPESVRDPYGVAVVPRNRWVAMLANRTARLLRALGLHALPNLGKTLGLKKWLLDGGSRPPATVPTDDLAVLRQRLAGETRFVEALNLRGVVTAADCATLWQLSR